VRRRREFPAQPREAFGEEMRRQAHDAVTCKKLEHDREQHERHAPRQAELSPGDRVHHADGKAEQRQREQAEQHHRRVHFQGVGMQVPQIELIAEHDARHQSEGDGNEDGDAAGSQHEEGRGAKHG